MLKKLFIIAGLFVFAFILSSETAFSQKNEGKWSNKTPQDRATMRADKLKDNLSLSESQYTQIYDIFLSHFNEVQTLRNLDRGDRQSRREEMKTKREGVHAKIGEILSPAQRERWESFKSERKQHRESRSKERNKRQESNRSR